MVTIWSETATKNYRQNLRYLLEEWGYSVMKQFIIKVEKTIEKIKIYPNIGAYDEKIGCYKILIVKQIYLFYDVNNKNLHVLDVWNNYKKPFWN
ncbi:type II toxin-antitoxin system RelE/ParE family toxin [Aequorivita sp. F47161]|uniref:Type II toxin-antitoxin system RelE/ParE family toxin n=1 Tax=Aequorivita vitellina TaxID=2874475 RepID=A0A9X1QZL3_9FLAO|nr:type II toxin-antitoxin system RelE/ParE family toxin [Aequorivita vitellina]MCG2420307.1 type II toxin-antitoxin system RelE/ParE family toxin [Aequorivita vitellina]